MMKRKFIDIQDMPNFNLTVKDNIDSVSKGLVIMKTTLEGIHTPDNPRAVSWVSYNTYPYCVNHGAMNKVSKDGIWRCLQDCGVGCYEVSVSRPSDKSE